MGLVCFYSALDAFGKSKRREVYALCMERRMSQDGLAALTPPSLGGWFRLLFGFRGFVCLGRVTAAHHPTGKPSNGHRSATLAFGLLATWNTIHVNLMNQSLRVGHRQNRFDGPREPTCICLLLLIWRGFRLRRSSRGFFGGRRIGLFWLLGDGPHVHGDGPIRFHNSFPDLRKDDIAIRAHEIIMALRDVRSNDFDVKKGLLDEVFHSLNTNSPEY